MALAFHPDRTIEGARTWTARGINIDYSIAEDDPSRYGEKGDPIFTLYVDREWEDAYPTFADAKRGAEEHERLYHEEQQ